jgi:hypothetical protein
MIPRKQGQFDPRIIAVVCLTVILFPLPFANTGVNSSMSLQPTTVPQPSSFVPVLRPGDTWNYHLGIEGNSIQSIHRTEPCGNVQCVLINEVNAAYNDTRWIVPGNWSLYSEYCVGCEGPNIITNTNYALPRQLFAFPLRPGGSWWWNGTVSGWTSNPNGNNTFSGSVSILRTVVNETSVTVQAGTFDAYLVAEYGQNGTMLDGYSWFSLEAATPVREISLTNAVGVIDSRELISYQIVAVNVGETVRLGDISVTYKTNDTSPGFVGSSLNSVDSIESTVQNVTGTNVTLSIIMTFRNGTQSGTTNTTDISTGSPSPTSLGPLVIEAGLRGGNIIPNWQAVSVNYTRSTSYLGIFREVSILNSTQPIQLPLAGSIKVLRYWDRATGFLLATLTEMKETYFRNGSSYFLTESISARVVSTNLWQGFVPGVKVGDWVKYGEFSASWTSNIPGDQNIVGPYQDTYWRIDRISGLSGRNVSVGSTVVLANPIGSREYTVSGNVSSGIGNLTNSCLVPCIVPANLRAGDPVFDLAYSPTAPSINQTFDKFYLGVHRRVNILNLTITFSMPYAGSSTSVGIYDQVTGVLLEFFYSNSLTYQNYARTAFAHYKITETNLWNATTHPSLGMRVLPALLALRPGSYGTFMVMLTSLKGFADSVELTVAVSPTGPGLGPVPGRLTVAASPLYSTSVFLLNVSAGPDLSAGVYNVTLTGTNGLITQTMTLPVLVYRPVPVECGTKTICYIVANVTISDVKSAGGTIHFTANGPRGIIGYANVTIPATSVPDPNSLEVIVDKAQLPPTAFQINRDATGHEYIVQLTFMIHGSVNVDLLLGGSRQPNQSQPLIQLNPTNIGLIGVSLVIFASLGVEAFRKMKERRREKKSPDKSGGKDRSPRWASILKNEPMQERSGR